MGHRPIFGQQVTTFDIRAAVKLKERAERLGLRAGIHSSGSRAKYVASLRELYPGASIEQLRTLGFHEVQPFGWLKCHATNR